MWSLPYLTNSEHLTNLEKLLHQGHCELSYSVRATMTKKTKNKKHKLCDLNSRNLFLLVLVKNVQGQGASQIGFILRSLLLAYRGSPSGHVLT